MEEMAETSTRKRIKKVKWVEQQGETNEIFASNWIPMQSALMVSVDQGPTSMLAALEQRKQQQLRNQLSA
jgi:hypothetical protein